MITYNYTPPTTKRVKKAIYLVILVILFFVSGIVYACYSMFKGVGMLVSAETGNGSSLYELYPFEQDGKHYFISVEGVFKTNSYEQNGGMVSRSGTTSFRLGLFNLGNGEKLQRLVTSDSYDQKIKVMGKAGNRIWFYSTANGLHSRSLPNLAIDMTAEKIIAANKELAAGLAKADKYFNNLDELFTADETANAIMVTTINGKNTNKEKIAPAAHVLLSKYDIEKQTTSWQYDLSNNLTAVPTIESAYVLNNLLVIVLKTHPKLMTVLVVSLLIKQQVKLPGNSPSDNMKKIIRTSITSLAFCLLTICVFAQKKTAVVNKKNKQPALKTNSLSKEEILGQQVFDVLKANNLVAWHKLYPTYEEYAGMLDQMLAAKMDNITPQKVSEDKEGYKKESDEVFRKDALKLLYQAADLKIQWKDASFNKFDYVTSFPNDLPCKYMKGTLYFYCGESVFLIEGIEALEVGDTFKLQTVKRITIQSRQHKK